MTSKSDRRVPIVGIGASAGGIEALMEFFSALPSDTQMAYIVILHIQAKKPSQIRDIIAKHTEMSVVEARDGAAIEPNRVYVIVPGAYLLLRNSTLKVVPFENKPGHPQNPINRFLLSLAENDEHPAAAVILSGTGSDGTIGVREIKEKGGLIFAQDPKTTLHSSMPENAISTEAVDFILSPTGIAEELGKLSRDGLDELNASSASVEESARDEILSLLRREKGVDFSLYKQSTVSRRIARRLAVKKFASLKKYVEILRQNVAELDCLYHDLLINVTHFFRDPDSFVLLAEKVFPALLEGRKADEPIRIWVPACASGEEGYSLGISLIEFLEKRKASFPIQIFGTDLSEPAIHKARAGIYSEAIAAEISESRLRRFFEPLENGYQVVSSLRAMCTFARQDITSDPPLSRMDLVSCRNLLIYFSPTLQQKVLPVLHYSLKRGGFLWLGKAEVVDAYPELFSPVDKTHKIYRKSTTAAPKLSLGLTLGRGLGKLEPLGRPGAPRLPEVDLQHEGGRLLLANYSPPAVLISEQMEALHFWGHTGDYLEPGVGRASLNLLKLARPDLAPELKKMVEEITCKNLMVLRRDEVRFAIRGEIREVGIRIIVIRPPVDLKEKFFLIVFEETPRAVQPSREVAGVTEQTRTDEVNRLKDEIITTRTHLQRIIDEREMANEELQSANEEVMSTNEELQTINQELETAKEELQSANEELSTVNDELQQRVSQLKRSGEFITAIFDTIREPLLVLDRELKIAQGNRAFRDAFSFELKAHESAPLSRLGEEWQEESLLQFFRKTLLGHRPNSSIEVACFVPRRSGQRIFRVTAAKIIQQEEAVDAVLVALDDITEQRQIDETRKKLSAIVESSNDGIISWDVDGKIQSWNHAAETIFGYRADEVLGQNLIELVPDTLISEFRSTLDEVRRGQALKNWETILLAKKGIAKNVSVTISPIKSSDGNVLGASTTVRDITEKKIAEEQLKESEQRFRLLVSGVREYAIFMLDADGRIISWNEGAKRIYGYEAPEVVGKHFSVFYLDQDNHSKKPDRELRIAREHGKYEEEGSRLRADASRFEAHVLITAVWNGKILTGYSKVVQDITSRKEFEKRLSDQAELIDLAHESIIVRDPDDKILFWNKGAEFLFGWSEPEAMGKIAHNLLNTVFPVPLEDIKRAILKDGFWEAELRHTTREGKKIVVASRWSKRTNRHGEVTGFLEIDNDITERRKAQEALQKMNETLERQVSERTRALQQSNEELERFAFVSSHDLKEPLRMVSMFTKLLQKKYQGKLDAEANQYIEMAQNGSQRMAALIDGLLRYSRVGKEMHFAKVSIDEIVRQSLQNLDASIKEAKAGVEFRELPTIEGDRTLLLQLFQNLIDNAVKFRADEPPKVWIEAKRSNGSWLFWVKDNGIGIERQYLERIFTMFQRLHSIADYPGSGIGLATCKKIVEQHGGKMWVESKPGAGTTFFFTLPEIQTPVHR